MTLLLTNYACSTQYFEDEALSHWLCWFSKSATEKVLDQIIRAGGELTVEGLIKSALKALVELYHWRGIDLARVTIGSLLLFVFSCFLLFTPRVSIGWASV